MSAQTDTETLVESFCTLADEVQDLIDRKTILEHKLRFAAEQQLADKYASRAPEIADTLANLQLPPEHKPTIPSSYVPLPRRGPAGCNQHQIALLIRDGRRAAQQLVQAQQQKEQTHHRESEPRPARSHAESVANSQSQHASSALSHSQSPGPRTVTAMSTIMELDFTVEGKKGVLACPFSSMKREQQLQRQKAQLEQENQQLHIGPDDTLDSHETHESRRSVGGEGEAKERDTSMAAAPGDPMCAVMDEAVRAPSSGGAARCPIRFLDQHSPEEVASYVEKHKHQLPRSHAICLRRYNKNEDQIRRMDAKYGSLANMISGLGQFHQPMLTSAEAAAAAGVEVHADPEAVVDRAAQHRASHERVQKWARSVSADGDHGSDERGRASERANDADADADRPLKEVRLGESPSRPWGIAVPASLHADAKSEAKDAETKETKEAETNVRRCPFDHGQFGKGAAPPPGHAPVSAESESPPQAKADTSPQAKADTSPQSNNDTTQTSVLAEPPHMSQTTQIPSTTSAQEPQTGDKPHQYQYPSFAQYPTQYAQYATQPTFVHLPPPPGKTQPQAQPQAQAQPEQHQQHQHQQQHQATAPPQMVFTGPVFIGYPMDQALQFMQHYQPR